MNPRTVLPRVLAASLLVLAILFGPAGAAAETVHTIAKGQTLGAIAKRYRVTVAALREANGLAPNERIFPGKRLIIPEKGEKGSKTPGKAQAGDKDKGGKANEPANKTREVQGNSRGKAAKSKPTEPDAATTDKGDRAKSKAEKAASEVADARQYDGKVERDEKPKRPGLVHLRRGDERYEIQLLTRKGRLVGGALPKLRRALRHAPSGQETPIDARLATLLGMVSNHFGGRTIEIVSGFRPYSPKQYTPHSNHNLGRAVDFRVEGVPNTRVRDYCRTFRNAGVGYYPNSTFVHLDVRTVKTYWVDYSSPGQRPRYSLSAPAPAPDDAAEAESDAAGDPEGESLPTPPGPASDSAGKAEDHPRPDGPPASAPQVSQDRPTPDAPPPTPSQGPPREPAPTPSPPPSPPPEQP